MDKILLHKLNSTRWLLPAFYFIWAGMILGVSFIATPVKFHAVGLTLPVALAVGKVTFHLFCLIEWGVFLCIVTLIGFSGFTRKNLLGTAPLFIILLLQTFWLLPILDVRIDAIITGASEHTSPGYMHWIYIISECVKVLLVVISGIHSKEERS